MLRHYEFRFVTKNGRVLRGPIFKASQYDEYQRVMDQIHNMTVLRLQMGRQRFVIPEKTLKSGYAEIKPMGFVRALFRTWMAGSTA